MSSLNVCFVLLSQKRGLHMWPTALGGLDHVGSVTTYIAEIRPAACEDRTLIEQGKGGGRLPPKKISERLFRPQEPLDLRNEMGDPTQGISHINRLSVVV